MILHKLLLMFMAIGIGFPIAYKLDLPPLACGLWVGGLNILFNLMWP